MKELAEDDSERVVKEHRERYDELRKALGTNSPHGARARDVRKAANSLVAGSTKGLAAGTKSFLASLHECIGLMPLPTTC